VSYALGIFCTWHISFLPFPFYFSRLARQTKTRRRSQCIAKGRCGQPWAWNWWAHSNNGSEYK